MRSLVLSDIHANIDALEAVLAAADTLAYDDVLVLGDLVGYGAAPNEVIARIQGLSPLAVIRGNHDKVAAGLGDTENFNPLAKKAADWTRQAMTPAYTDYLARLPQGPLQVDADLEICHGTPFDEDAYIFDSLDAMRAIHAATKTLCLFGHTHVPLMIGIEDNELVFEDNVAGATLELKPHGRYLVNVGSVGQPRDGDPRASFAVIDTVTRTVAYQRVTYDIAAAQGRIRAAGLPEPLALRLAAGR
jgi:diadenosine tetraphosphatase ApaH/serine/threonine PP2A family protein phosphatase